MSWTRMAILGVTIVCVAAVALTKTFESRELPISYMPASYVIDVQDLNAVTGYADHVFVGKVLRETGTEYLFEGQSPFTNYEIEVLAVLKGDLRLGVIPVQKRGGLDSSKEVYFIPEDDFLPQKGDICIFRASTQRNGALLLSGPNSTNLIFNEENCEGNILEAAKKSSVYTDAVKACENEIPYEKPRSATAEELRG